MKALLVLTLLVQIFLIGFSSRQIMIGIDIPLNIGLIVMNSAFGMMNILNLTR